MYKWISLATSADLAQLPNHITSEYNPGKVAKTLSLGISDAVKGVLIEYNYIDKDYRSTYYNFYSKKGQYYRSDCVRLHFFDQTVTFDDATSALVCPDRELNDHYFGYMVLRPTGIATIARSVLSPDIRKGAGRFIITAAHKVHLLGYKLVIQGFPSMDQHVDISVCAHAACWSILRHYSERYNVHREYLVHEITMMAHDYNPGGLVPSKGLQIAHAERVFQEAGTFPIHIARTALPGTQDPQFYRQLIAYVESGFPLFAAMHSRRHAVALVGYEWRQAVRGQPGLRYAWDEVETLAVVDDNYLPYLSILRSSGSPYAAEAIDAFIVALPEKIYYPADAVDRLAPALLKLGPAIDLPPSNDIIIRYFITTGSSYRHFAREHASEFDPKLLQYIMTLPYAQFIWVVEFSTDEQWANGRIEARAVIDATASLREPMPLWLFHGREGALIFDRKKIGQTIAGMGGLKLANIGHAGFTRMDRNLRPTQTK
ncbi:hypothetical protein QA640_07045 [Bradyrhizobium sp. CB82]|uniref:hypothetical protein n=1 Tax=Bradyrhizobium sp. CB82 TaxID=3039159 RepID=UPI0024B279C6|nr:hypothetical protein [Bradyrhizobium sp. CB82]WFU42224.1 hypothetical protein QA640_07045 [Bradyrhizobium sp. CB82]